MEKNNKIIMSSLFCIALFFGVVMADLASMFSYSDVPFVIGIVCYLVFVYIQRASSQSVFTLALFFLLWMGASYVPTGPSKITERIGEWFYIFFALGITQSIVSVLKRKNAYPTL
jgi:hypothetical protein